MNTFIAIGLGFLVLAALVAVYYRGKQVAKEKERSAQAWREAVAKLPGWQPQLLQMRAEGYNYLEIAAKLGLDKDFVLAEITAALVTLRMNHMPIEQRGGRERVPYFFLWHLLNIILKTRKL
jgi:hypothetical protein